MKSMHTLQDRSFYSIAFFWRADEAVLTRNSVRRLQTAAFHVIDSCLDEQPLLPTDLSDFAV